MTKATTTPLTLTFEFCPDRCVDGCCRTPQATPQNMQEAMEYERTGTWTTVKELK